MKKILINYYTRHGPSGMKGKLLSYPHTCCSVLVCRQETCIDVSIGVNCIARARVV